MRVHALQTGTVTVKERQRRGRGPGPVRTLATMATRKWTEPLPILAWAVEHPDGLIVVDAGEVSGASRPGWFPSWHPYFRLAVSFRVTPDQELGPSLRAAGLDPADVKTLVLTHLHTDHAAGMGQVPNAEILVARAEWEAAQGFAGKLRGYLPHRFPADIAPRLLDLPEERYGPFQRSMEVAPGVHAVATPGHSPGHLSVVLEDGDCRIVLAGDTSYDQEALLAQEIDGVSPDAGATRDTLRRMLELCREAPTVYLPSHDPGSAARLEAREPVPA